MKIKAFIGTTMAAVMIAGCSNEFELTNETLHEGVLKVTVEDNNPVSRVGFDANGKFYWSNTDAIGVTTSNVTTSFTKLDLKQGGGTASATFSGTINGTIEGYAIYPYSDNHSISSNQLTFNFPESYTYDKVDQDFFTTTKGDGNSFNPAMVGKITNNSVTLKHLGGVFCIKVSSMPVASGKLTLTTDKKINGNFTYNLSDDTSTETVIQASTTSTDENTVAINFSGATTNSPGVFYIPVPAGTYSNIRIKMYNGSGDTNEEINVAAGTYTINRKDLKVINLTTGSIDATTPTIVDDASDVSTSLESNDAVSVSGEITGTSTINIPTFTEDNATKSLILENIASNTSLTISESSSEPNNSVENFTLSIPNNDAADFTPLNLNINLPNTTVALAANAGTATFNEVTASTADNTLIIEEGVTVKKLIVNKGNVRVNKGAKIESLKNNTSSNIYLINEGGEVTKIEGNNVTTIDGTAYDLMMTCKNGGEYTLASDVTGDFIISADKTVIINLNGKTITNKSGDTFTVTKGGTLTINGIGTVDNITHGKACIYNNGTVTLNGGKYTRSKEASTSTSESGGNSYYNILNHGVMTINSGANIISTGAFSSLIDNGYFNYKSTNERLGYVDTIGHANPSLTINGGNFSGGINTIKNDDGATLKIEDGTFANTTQATVHNNNVATINGGVYNPTNSATDAVQTRYYESGVNAGETTISGGTFNGKLYLSGANAKLTISGGTFSDPSALAYLAANADVKIAFNGDYEGPGLGIFKNGNGDSATVEIDLGGHTWTLNDEPLFGSPGTESQYFHLEKGATVTIKNGTVRPKNSAGEKMFFQNYCNLTLENMTVEGDNNCRYVMSNNNGSCTIKKSTITASKGKCAFDVYYWAKAGYESVTVTIEDSKINGNVEFGGERASGDDSKKGKLIIKDNSVMNGNLTVTEGFYDPNNPNIVIDSSVTFGDDVEGWDSYKNISE